MAPTIMVATCDVRSRRSNSSSSGRAQMSLFAGYFPEMATKSQDPMTSDSSAPSNRPLQPAWVQKINTIARRSTLLSCMSMM